MIAPTEIKRTIATARSVNPTETYVEYMDRELYEKIRKTLAYNRPAFRKFLGRLWLQGVIS